MDLNDLPPGGAHPKKFFLFYNYDTWTGPKKNLTVRGRCLTSHPDSQTATLALYIYMSMYPVGQPFFEIEYAICFKRKAPSARKHVLGPFRSVSEEF